MSERRQVILSVSEGIISGFICAEPLYPVNWTTAPKDLRILSARTNLFRGNVIELLCESDEFELVDEGSEPPVESFIYSSSVEKPEGDSWRRV